MSEDKKSKTLSYRRSVFLSPGGTETLQHLITSARKKLGGGYRIPAVDEHPAIEERHYKTETNVGIFLHIAAFTPGEEASIVPHDNNGDLATTPPPDNSDFMDGDIMALVAGNDVVLCSNSLHEKQLERYIAKLLDLSGLNGPQQIFELSKAANVDRIKMIQKAGVKEIWLDSTFYEASFIHDETETIRKKLTGKLMDEFKALFYEEGEEISVDEAENLTVKLVLSYDKRRKGADFIRKKLEMMADKAYSEDDEGIKIVTYSGDTISASDITLKKAVKINSHAKSVFYDDAWKELDQYYIDLKNGGFLEM